MDVALKTAEENSDKSQQKQKEAYAKKSHKKYRNVVYSVNDEVLLLNMRKQYRNILYQAWRNTQTNIDPLSMRPSIIFYAPAKKQEAFDACAEVKYFALHKGQEPVLHFDPDAKTVAQEGHNQSVIFADLALVMGLHGVGLLDCHEQVLQE